MHDDLRPEERDKLELERIEDLVTTAKQLAGRGLERLSIDTLNYKRLRVLAQDARIMLIAAVSVLDRL